MAPAEPRRANTGCIRVFLVEDHEIVRASLTATLSACPDITIAGEAGNGEEALDRVPVASADVVLLDYGLPDMTGAELCQRLIERRVAPRIVILSASIDEQQRYAGLMAGADAYCIKDVRVEVLMEVLRSVAADDGTRIDALANSRANNWTTRLGDPERRLSPALRRVLRLAGEGKTNAEISAELGISKNTVKGYLARACDALGVRGRAEAMALAKRRGLI